MKTESLPNFIWYCKKSPDKTCHYYSDSYALGQYWVCLRNDKNEPLGIFHDPEYETKDRCLFCGKPEDRQ